MVAIPLSGVLGGPVSGALLSLDGRLGLAGWQWLFLLEGLPAVLLGFIVLLYLTDRPQDASWLTPEERTALSRRVVEERTRSELRHGYSVRQALSNRTVWQLGFTLMLCNAFGVYVMGLWLPQIVRESAGLTNFQVGLVSAVPNLVAAVAMVLVGAHSDRTGERVRHVAGTAAMAAVGFTASAVLDSPVLIVLALSLAMAGLLASHGPFWPLPTMFLTGSAAAGGIGLITSIANFGGFLGPYAMGVLKTASGNFRAGLFALALISLAGAGLALRLRKASVLAAVLSEPGNRLDRGAVSR
jgi:sugar phosphate permease